MGTLETTYVLFGIGTTVGAGALCLVYVLRHKGTHLSDLLLIPQMSKRRKAILQKHKKYEKIHAKAKAELKKAMAAGDIQKAQDALSKYKADLVVLERENNRGVNPNLIYQKAEQEVRCT